MICSRVIDTVYFNIWYDQFNKHQGRFISNPRIVGEKVYVCYTFTDMELANDFHYMFDKFTMPIVEIPYSRWRKFKRKLKKLFTKSK